MTTRRGFLTLVGAGAVAGLVGCYRPAPVSTETAGLPDLVIAEAGPLGPPANLRSGLVVVRGGRLDRYELAVLSARAERIYTARAIGADTEVIGIDPAQARVRSTGRFAGLWQPRVASTDGSLLALTAPGQSFSAGVPGPSERTPILIADGERELARLAPAGNYAVDAFSSTGTSLFVLDWLPASSPQSYRVRQLDLNTGEPTPLLTRNKVPVPLGAEELMRGQVRSVVYSPNMQVLYTLYTHQPDHTHTRDLLAGRRRQVHAFVHTLCVAENWAYCVDLPQPFGAGPAIGHTIAAGPEGGRVYVADLAGGRLAVIDTTSLSVLSVSELPARSGPAFAAVTLDRLFVGAATSINVIDRRDHRLTATVPVARSILGLAVDATGERLYVGHDGAISWQRTEDGARLGEISVPGLTGLRCVSAV